MFIRLKDEASNDLNLNINHLVAFQPSKNGTGSTLTFSDGRTGEVQDSTRSIRGYVKKVLASINSGGATESDEG